MGNVVHETKRVLVWADVDAGIADLVCYLNAIPGVTTHSSCQGTIGEGGAKPYRPYVLVSFGASALELLAAEFELSYVHSEDDEGYCRVHPRAGWVPPPTLDLGTSDSEEYMLPFHRLEEWCGERSPDMGTIVWCRLPKGHAESAGVILHRGVRMWHPKEAT
jgi:hypothetical protein